MPDHSSPALSAKLIPVVAAGLSALVLWRLLQRCRVAVHPKCSAILFETRRRTVLCTTEDGHRRLGSQRYGCARYLARVLRLYSRTHLLIPPSSFFGVFTMPKTVFDPPGECATLTIKNVQTNDGAVHLVLCVHYVIPFEELERYLTAVGPLQPTELIASAAATVLRLKSCTVSVGILLSRTRRDNVFIKNFTEHLETKLMSEAAIRVCNVSIESVEPLACD